MALGVVTVLFSSPAHAYRPFEGTDAAVTTEGIFELELGPSYAIHRARRAYLTLPAMVLNLGIAPSWELVFDANNVIPTQGLDGQMSDYIDSTDLLLKRVLRKGSLQDGEGISIAAEFGALLPNVNGQQQGVGGVLDVIFSQQWRPLTLHLNAQGALARNGNLEALGTLIVEGPRRLVVRPVLEIGADRQAGAASIYFGLLGAIWTVNDTLAFDAGVRGAVSAQDRIAELRLGLTWDAIIWPASSPSLDK